MFTQMLEEIKLTISEIYSQFAGFGLNSHFPSPSIGMWPEEIQRLMYCQLKAPNLNSLVVGSHNGGSECVLELAKQSKNDDSSVIGVDIKFSEYYPLIKNRFKNKFNRNLITWEMDSSLLKRRYITALDEGQIDGSVGLVFIDGYHSYSKSLDDFNQVKEFLVKDSIVCFHDCTPDPIKSGHKIPDEYVSQYEDFYIDEAINTILEQNPEFVEFEIPIGMNCDRRREAQRTEFIRGSTSPFNSLYAIVKQ